MKKKIKEIIKHPLISGSMILVVGSILANVLNYFFNLGMGRLLSVSNYGVLASLISMINIFAVFSTTIMTVFTKFTASFVGQGKKESIGILFKKGTIWVGMFGLIIFIIIFLFSKQIASFLNMEDLTLIYITGIALFFSFISSVIYGILQGLLKFVSFSILNIVSSFIKLAIGLGLVILGFNLVGAMAAILISSIFGYFFVFPFIYKSLLKSKNNNIVIPDLNKQLYSYSFPVFLSTLGITVLTSIDIILTKHYFNSVLAGQYAALSLMGRSIFYVVSPIASVLFPLIAQKKEKKENLSGTLLLSLSIVGGVCAILSLIYFLFPQLVLMIFFPAKEYKSLVPYLGPFSIFIFFFALSWVINTYYLSIGKTRVFIFSLAGAILESLYIFFFHQNITQIITGLIAISFLLLIALLLYYPYVSGERD